MFIFPYVSTSLTRPFFGWRNNSLFFKGKDIYLLNPCQVSNILLNVEIRWLQRKEITLFQKIELDKLALENQCMFSKYRHCKYENRGLLFEHLCTQTRKLTHRHLVICAMLKCGLWEVFWLWGSCICQSQQCSYKGEIRAPHHILSLYRDTGKRPEFTNHKTDL